MSRQYTPEQQNVISFPVGNAPMQNMLVSASAGTGKTTVMIERIARLIREGTNPQAGKPVDVDKIVVVTFTNLAAAEMKNRLFAKLSEFADDHRVREQLEKLDNASICTLHSFCSDLLRNYFYVVDIDPAFTILDSVTLSKLKDSAIDELFKDYFTAKDSDFFKLYQIYSTNRQEENFKNLILKLHVFSRNLVDFDSWYAQKRQSFTKHDNNGLMMRILIDDINSTVDFCKQQFALLKKRCEEEDGAQLAGYCQKCLDALNGENWSTAQSAFDAIRKVDLPTLISKSSTKSYQPMSDALIEDKIRHDYNKVRDIYNKKAKGYRDILADKNIATLWEEIDHSLEITDKLVEIVQRFEQKFFALKKQRGGVDFNDLEHLALKVLEDGEVSAMLKEKYQYVFVDEYQDTNPVQEAIITSIVPNDHLFMVGDIKQSIYGFRGCDPGIFGAKQQCYAQNNGGVLEQLNDNFRSNKDILQFVNFVFGQIMTNDLGQVDYKNTACFRGATPQTLKQVASVRINLVKKPTAEKPVIFDYYDITQPTSVVGDEVQAKAIVNRIKSYVGMAYKDKEGNAKRIQYGDIVILMRDMVKSAHTNALTIYDALVAENIPVTASFKLDGFASKEVRELVNLLRVVDNPYNDVYLAGVCLCSFGNFTESDLAQIRLNTTKEIVPFFDRMTEYRNAFNNDISAKIDNLLNFVESLRFYSHGASVCDVVLQAIKQTEFNLYVEGLPNGALRLNKLNTFVDSLRGASYAESIDKFLYYLDESEENKTEQPLAQTNAVRIMTMHASKGLEFPIVILAGLENPFKFDKPHKTNYVLRNKDVGLTAYHYDFHQMKRYETLGAHACYLYNMHKQREEEMRLLYVAMTRPKFVLDIFATADDKQLSAIPRAPKDADGYLDWLMYILKTNNTTQLFEQNHVQVEVVESVAQGQKVSQQLLCEQLTDAQVILDNLSYNYPFASQTTMPTKIVSSALDKQYFDDEESLTAPVLVQDDKNKVGTAYHAVYQFVDYNADVDGIQKTIQQLVEVGKIQQQYADQLDVNLIYQTLQNPQLKGILQGGKVYHEIPFMLYAPYDQLAKDKRFSDKVMLQGVIDLLVVAEGKATVVDFKFTSRSDKVAERYPYQLNSYKMAVKTICGIDDVDAYVLSIADNKLIQM